MRNEEIVTSQANYLHLQLSEKIIYLFFQKLENLRCTLTINQQTLPHYFPHMLKAILTDFI